MNRLDDVLLGEFSQIANDLSYVRKELSKNGHVVSIENVPYVDGYIDRFGNSFAERIYLFENGRSIAILPWRNKVKLNLLY
ncbi:MAG: hypothetical protein KBT28_12380 [Bacteroidales bacterium]|nr:hypothetical protein [Candidatus Colimorpha merdihippi]